LFPKVPVPVQEGSSLFFLKLKSTQRDSFPVLVTIPV